MRHLFVLAVATVAGGAWACADFSGKWSGNCKEGTETYQAGIEIAQTGCTEIAIDGSRLTIGSPNTSTRTEQGVTETVSRTPSWDSGQAVLTEKTNVVAVRSGRTVFQLDSTTTYALQGGKLVSVLNESGREPGASPTARQASCTFDKQ